MQGAGESPIIRVENVQKIFYVARTRQTVQAVESADLQIYRGEFLSIVGPSGCGKSTLLNMIAGLEQPTAGRITMEGKPVLGPSADRGMCFQEYALFPWKTVWENVAFGLRYGPKGAGCSKQALNDTVRCFIDLVSLTGSESKYPHELSGGMRQRCALARLFAYDPTVLLMDEPLAAVDAQTRIVLQEELLRIWGQEALPANQRKTVVYVTHAIEEAVFLSDRVAIMSSQPAHTREVVVIDLPRPRTAAVRGEPRFRALTDQIWGLIRDEAYRATLR